jgi:hypothetical protein
MDFQFSVVFDKTQFTEFVREKAYARSGRADHLRQCFLTKLPAGLPCRNLQAEGEVGRGAFRSN